MLSLNYTVTFLVKYLNTHPFINCIIAIYFQLYNIISIKLNSDIVIVFNTNGYITNQVLQFYNLLNMDIAYDLIGYVTLSPLLTYEFVYHFPPFKLLSLHYIASF